MNFLDIDKDFVSFRALSVRGECLVRFMGYCDAGMSVGVNFVGPG